MFEKRRGLMFMVTTMLGLTLAACSGSLPTSLPDSVEFSDGGESIELAGTVEALGASEWTVSGVDFAVNSSTEIKGDFVVGDPVKVDAFLVGDTVTATEISQAEIGDEGDSGDDSAVKNDKSEDSEFIGTVDAMGPTSWTIDGTEVAIDASTEIEGGIAVGDMVKVEAYQSTEGVLTASEIKLAETDNGEDSSEDSSRDDGLSGEKQEFTGTVESIGTDLWVVDATPLMITLDTKIENGIQVGDMVKVEAAMDAEGNLIAHEIGFAQDDGEHDGEEMESADDETEDHDEHESEHEDSSGHESSSHEQDDD
ncbi:MAG: DUF5666 domain-containing protein [Anaerolineales bacterium]